MLTPEVQIYEKHEFPSLNTETTDANRAIKLSYGLGWGLYFTPYGRAFFKEGHDEGWRHYAVCFDKSGTGILIMTNSSNGEGIYKALLETLLQRHLDADRVGRLYALRSAAAASAAPAAQRSRGRVMASGGASGTRLFWYDAQGRVIEDTEGSNTNEYLYLGNQRISWVYDLGSTHYFYDDNLGTARMIVNSNGITCYDADYFPWGDEQHVYGNSCPQNYKFNDKERSIRIWGSYDSGLASTATTMARLLPTRIGLLAPEPVPDAQPQQSADAEPVRLCWKQSSPVCRC